VVSVTVLGLITAAYVFVPSVSDGVHDLAQDVSQALRTHKLPGSPGVEAPTPNFRRPSERPFRSPFGDGLRFGNPPGSSGLREGLNDLPLWRPAGPPTAAGDVTSSTADGRDELKKADGPLRRYLREMGEEGYL
jgi:hypothetical protein